MQPSARLFLLLFLSMESTFSFGLGNPTAMATVSSTQSDQCLPGHIKQHSTSECQECPPSTYALDSMDCVGNCPRGYINGASGNCEECPSGQSPSPNKDMCEPDHLHNKISDWVMEFFSLNLAFFASLATTAGCISHISSKVRGRVWHKIVIFACASLVTIIFFCMVTIALYKRIARWQRWDSKFLRLALLSSGFVAFLVLLLFYVYVERKDKQMEKERAGKKGDVQSSTPAITPLEALPPDTFSQRATKRSFFNKLLQGMSQSKKDPHEELTVAQPHSKEGFLFQNMNMVMSLLLNISTFLVLLVVLVRALSPSWYLSNTDMVLLYCMYWLFEFQVYQVLLNLKGEAYSSSGLMVVFVLMFVYSMITPGLVIWCAYDQELDDSDSTMNNFNAVFDMFVMSIIPVSIAVEVLRTVFDSIIDIRGKLSGHLARVELLQAESAGAVCDTVTQMPMDFDANKLWVSREVAAVILNQLENIPSSVLCAWLSALTSGNIHLGSVLIMSADGKPAGLIDPRATVFKECPLNENLLLPRQPPSCESSRMALSLLLLLYRNYVTVERRKIPSFGTGMSSIINGEVVMQALLGVGFLTAFTYLILTAHYLTISVHDFKVNLGVSMGFFAVTFGVACGILLYFANSLGTKIEKEELSKKPVIADCEATWLACPPGEYLANCAPKTCAACDAGMWSPGIDHQTAKPIRTCFSCDDNLGCQKGYSAFDADRSRKCHITQKTAPCVKSRQ